MKKEIKIRNLIIGYFEFQTSDNYWVIGKFIPGPKYEDYEQYFVEERKLNINLEDAETDEEYVKCSDLWQEAVEKINILNLTIDEEVITDFKIDDDNIAEFKYIS